MPAKNTLKQYLENTFYHVYNRGVEKREIFLDEQDYRVFIDRLRKYLDPDYTTGPGERYGKYMRNEVELIAYCLMPNHFHLLVRQVTPTAMEELMRRVMTAYSMYFNLKYARVGSLFQGRYKAVPVVTDEYLMHLSRYIHLNPCKSSSNADPQSSLRFYLHSSPAWVNPAPVLELFSNKADYAQFMNDNSKDTTTLLGGLTFD